MHYLEGQAAVLLPFHSKLEVALLLRISSVFCMGPDLAIYDISPGPIHILEGCLAGL